MKKLLYYSPFIPIIGLLVHLGWIYFRYDIYSVNEGWNRFFIPMILQIAYIGILTTLIS